MKNTKSSVEIPSRRSRFGFHQAQWHHENFTGSDLYYGGEVIELEWAEHQLLIYE